MIEKNFLSNIWTANDNAGKQEFFDFCNEHERGYGVLNEIPEIPDLIAGLKILHELDPGVVFFTIPFARYLKKENMLNEAVIKELIEQTGENFIYFPEQHQTIEHAELCAASFPNVILHVDSLRISPVLAELAVKGNGLLLRFVPVALRTKEILMAAVESDFGAIMSFTPDDFFKLDDILGIVQILAKHKADADSEDPFPFADIIDYIPKELRSKEVIEFAETAT